MIKVAMFPNPSGSRYWRLEDPAKYLNMTGEFEVRVVEEGINDEVAKWADIYVLQGCVDKMGIATLAAFRDTYDKKIVVDADDFIDLNPDNPHQIEHAVSNAAEVVRITMEMADLITTTTPYLAKKLKEINKNVVVLPNYMDLERWNLKTLKNDSDEIRVGWVGSITHLKDIESVRKPLINLLINRPNVKLILVGDLRFKEMFKGFNVEVMLGVPFESYPARLHGLRLDIGIAPLVDNEFNRCKSPIKCMEYGICGVPVVASDVIPYNTFVSDTYTGYLAHRETGWLTYLEILVDNPDIRTKVGLELKAEVMNKYSLQKNIGKWAKAYKALFE